jgi:hypothetical protein
MEIVILSGVFLREAKENEVEGPRVSEQRQVGVAVLFHSARNPKLRTRSL